MHIIFGSDNAEILKDKFTILELDTFKIVESNTIIPAYCVVENLPIDDLPDLEQSKQLHQELVEKYRQREWDFCLDAINQLIGRWGGEADTFYEELRNRIENYKLIPPTTDWSPVILKAST